jgi:hypothetical protein
MKRSISLLLFFLLLTSLLIAGCAAKQNANVGNPGQSKVEAATATPVLKVTEEFKSNETNTWSDPVFIVGNPKMAEIDTQSNSLSFNLKDLETYVYKFYDKEAYDDVEITANVSNLGDNSNGIALICRASDQGWYEFRASSGGTYEVFAYEQSKKDHGENPYRLIESGGSGLINAKDNKLGFSCKGTSLKMFANDKEIKPSHGPIDDSAFTKGKVGVGTMSFKRVPVKLAFDKVTIATPQ